LTNRLIFTEYSSSTLDLLIVNDHRNIVFSGVGAPLLNRTHYHLPIIGFLNHYIERSTIIRRKIFLCDRGDYYAYRQKLSTIDWDSMFTGHNIDSITCSIRQTITDIANDTIPNRIISIRKDNPPWLTIAIKKQIRCKKRIHKQAKQTNLEGHWVKFRKARNICNK
jgi:hypothetical protein